MRRALDLAMDGHGQIVAAMAEAGTGKSRLFHEFKATHTGDLQGARSLLGLARQGVGVAAGAGTPARLLRHPDADDAAARREKVRDVTDVARPSAGRNAAVPVRIARHRRRP